MAHFLDLAVPETWQWISLAGCVLAFGAFAGLGALLAAEREFPESTIFSGWGFAVFVLTVLGVVFQASLGAAFWILMIASVAALAWRVRAGGAADLFEGWRFILFGLPFLVIVAGKWPSEVDSFSHWIENGRYLFAHDGFPRPDAPPPVSRFPGFPYNFSFVFYVAGRLTGGFAENAAILANAFLLLIFSALLGRLIRLAHPEKRVAFLWSLVALAFLLATLLNPVFVRRIILTSYPDMSTAVVTAFVGVLAWRWLVGAARDGIVASGATLSLALALTLLVNIKQANLVLVLLALIMLAMVAWRDKSIRLGVFFRALPLLAGLPLILYFAWRYHLAEIMPMKENELAPFAKWPFHAVPNLLGHMGVVLFKKSPHFLVGAFFALWGAISLYRRRFTDFDRLAVVAGGIFLGYNAFLFLIFVAHFNGYPQSYWRFNTHVGYLLWASAVHGLALLYWRHLHARLSARSGIPRWAGLLRWAGMVSIVGMLALQVGLVRYWRFDLETPKPLLRQVGLELASTLPKNAAVLAVIPGDIGDLSAIFGRYGRLDRPDLYIGVFDPRKLAPAAARHLVSRPTYVWVYCATADLKRDFALDAEPGNAYLLAPENGTWSIVKRWPHPKPGGLIRVYKNFDTAKCDS